MNEPRGPLRVLRLTETTVGGGDLYTFCTPPAGEIWDLWGARASHDEGGDLAMGWYVHDSESGFDCAFPSSARQVAYLGPDMGIHPTPLRLNHQTFVCTAVLGLSAGKTVTIYLLVERILGADPAWTGL